jgi:hypothetical protein
LQSSRRSSTNSLSNAQTELEAFDDCLHGSVRYSALA